MKIQVTFIAQWNTWHKKNENKTQKAHVNWKSKILSFMHEHNLKHKICYTVNLFHASTCFEHTVLETCRGMK